MTWGYFFAAVGFGAAFSTFISYPLWAPRVGAALDRRIRAHVSRALEPSPVVRLDEWERHASNVRRIDSVKRVQG
jgi:hypothetical protein